MNYDSILWDLDDDSEGNVQHCALHGVTKAEVLDVFDAAKAAEISNSSDSLVIFGYTQTGRHLIVVFDEIDEFTARPVTSYDVPERQ